MILVDIFSLVVNLAASMQPRSSSQNNSRGYCTTSVNDPNTSICSYPGD